MTQYIDELTTAASADYVRKRVANPDYPVYNDEYELKLAFEAGAKWGIKQTEVKIQAQSIAVAHGCPKESVSENLEEAAKKAGQKYFPDKDNIWARPNYEAMAAANAFKEGAKWQKGNLWKNAQGDDLPEIDREVIALLNNGKVVFAHRPPERWYGRNLDGEEHVFEPKTYDKGEWNIPNVVWWLDLDLPIKGK